MTVKLTVMQESALLEAGNIGSGHAAIALSQLMGRKIMVAIPSIQIASLGELGKAVNDGVRSYVHVSLYVLGDVKGAMIFTLDNDMAKVLCDVVMGQAKGQTREFGEIESSALQEIGSILSASYLNAVGEMTDLSLLVSVPEFATGKIDVIKKLIKDKKVEVGDPDQVFCIRTEFIEAETKIEGYLILFMEEDGVEKVIKALGV